MKNFVSLLALLIFIKNTSAKCYSSYDDLENDIFEGKKLKNIIEEAEEIIGNEKLFLLNTKIPYYLWRGEEDETEKNVLSYGLLEKLTQSYSKYEVKPFTAFVACFSGENKNFLIFENFGKSLVEDINVENEFKKKGDAYVLKFFSQVYNLLQRLSDLNIVVENLLEMILIQNNKPVFFLTNNLFENSAPSSGYLKAPEEINEKKVFPKSNTYTAFLMTLYFLNNFDRPLRELNPELSEITTKEKNQELLEKLHKVVNDSALRFSHPNLFVKIWKSFVSIFKDNRTERAYDLNALMDHAMSFEMKDRASDASIADQLVVLSYKLLTPVVEIGEGVSKIVL
jgi:hypothetical protein